MSQSICTPRSSWILLAASSAYCVLAACGSGSSSPSASTAPFIIDVEAHDATIPDGWILRREDSYDAAGGSLDMAYGVNTQPDVSHAFQRSWACHNQTMRADFSPFRVLLLAVSGWARRAQQGVSITWSRRTGSCVNRAGIGGCA